jgi:hypothetical protein
VAEVLNLQALEGYATGGTLHIISNNQVGFTTDPRDGRSTRYASDLAKGFDVPIVHVNADDVDACMAAVHLAVDFRRRFGHDVIIDLIGYRRFGHNETDEPAYTQPDMYERIKTHPTVRELYAQKLIAQGIITADDANAMLADATARIAAAHTRVKSGALGARPARLQLANVETADAALETSVDADKLLALERRARGRAARLHDPSQARAPARTAQGVLRERGRFRLGPGRVARVCVTAVRRHADPADRPGHAARHVLAPARRLPRREDERDVRPDPASPDARASFEIYNSPLSEYACLGFEYGYAVEARGARALGSAVRRLQQRRADHHRSVHRRRPGEVGRDLAPRAACCRTATRVRAPSIRARASNASCSYRPKATCTSRTARRPRSTSTCCACKRGSRATAAGRLHAQEPAAPQSRGRLPARTDQRRVRTGDRRGARSRTTAAASSACCFVRGRSITT